MIPQKLQAGLSIWINGLSGSGKSTIAESVKKILAEEYPFIKILDGDSLRKGLSKDLSFSLEDRIEHIRRVAEINSLFLEEGFLILNSFIVPLKSMRLQIKEIIGEDKVFEIALTTPLNICMERDPKGLYKMAKAGIIENMTGISSPFERSDTCDLQLDTSTLSLPDCTGNIISAIRPHFINNH